MYQEIVAIDVDRTTQEIKEVRTMARCPRCGSPMTDGICDNCGFPMNRFPFISAYKSKKYTKIISVMEGSIKGKDLLKQ